MPGISWTGLIVAGVGGILLGLGLYWRTGGPTGPTALNLFPELMGSLVHFLIGTLLILFGATLLAAGAGKTLLLRGGVALLFMLTGAVIILFIQQLVAAPEQTLCWPKTEGVILEQYVPSVLYKPYRERFAERDMARVRYQYRVAGQTYQSDRVLFSGGKDDASYGSKVAQAFPVGARVPVYYNPAAPGEAVLDHETPRTVIKWAGYLAGVNFILAGIAAWFLFGLYLGK